MPADTAERIEQLCQQVLDARSDGEIESSLGELRAAIHEHLRVADDLARHSWGRSRDAAGAAQNPR
jgi:hypothetical protein